METAKLKKFAQFARRSLLDQVSAKLKLVLTESSAARRERVETIKKLEEAIKNHGKEQVIERVAYIWFNRFCALRFMDVNRHTRIGVVSPAEEQFQPEILAEAKMGHIDEEMVHDKVQQQIFALLDGKAPSRDPQGEAYRLLVVAACNFWNKAMPFLFQRIDDYTELLMPDDLLSGNSILAYTREAMTPDACEDVEVIGWLYQFYISEKKDEVFDGLKKNKKITPENIPAATQLFTPHWIVRYLVENSLGRLWMLNKPDSKLVDRMEYYIRPDTSGVRDQGLEDSKKVGGNDGSAKLSESDRLAEGYGYGGNSLSSDKDLSQGGALRADESGSSGGSIDSLEHSRGARSQLDSGVQELPFDSAGLQSRSGNSNPDRTTTALHITAASAGNTLFSQGNLQNAGLAQSQTNPWPLNPNPSASAREEDFLRVNKPEDIKICDPACGSGHMLTYAFDLLYAIYEEEGVDPAEISEKILTHNLYGIEIDERAGELAAFALTMKARAKQRRFFNKGVKPNICVLENVHFDDNELKDYMDFVGRDLFTAPLQTTLHQFEEADNFGSLICPDVTDVDGMLRILESKNVSGHLFLNLTHQKVLQALQQADYLSPKYHVVIANPPYMGGKGMNGKLGAWLKGMYPEASSDLMTAFMVRIGLLQPRYGLAGIVTLDAWMFLSTYEKLRGKLALGSSFDSLVHIGWNAFPDGHVYNRGVAFVVHSGVLDGRGVYMNLANLPAVANKEQEFLKALGTGTKIHRISSSEFKNIPGYPIAYWVSDAIRRLFSDFPSIGDKIPAKQGVATADNNRFLRFWWEPERNAEIFDAPDEDTVEKNGKKWVAYNKGGEYRRWFGNHEYVLDWKNRGVELYDFRPRSVIRNPDFFFKRSVSWSDVTSGGTAFRFYPEGFIFDSTGHSSFPNEDYSWEEVLCFTNTKICQILFDIVNPTIHHHVGYFKNLPALTCGREVARHSAHVAVDNAKSDWDAYETSWNFTTLPLLNPEYRQLTLKATYQKLRAHWREMTLEMQRLEEENNRIFIEAYGLQDELTPEVPLNEITLTCNPHYRYGGDKSEDELKALLLADTMRELISYAVGCMFGRYALDKPGLILVNQGETIDDYLKKVPNPSFPADDDNAIPLLDGDWFTDDIAERFKRFLKIAFGAEHYEENLLFIENSLNIKGKRNYNIRDYFLNEFYIDHVKRYKKRPIYWLFSSPKGSFNALIYMHRYRPDTASVVLNDYLREFRTKLTAHKNHLEAVSISASSSPAEKTKALKEIEKITRMITEMEEYEREVLYPLATEQIEIDLDDGVKVNYPKFGAALKKIPGLGAKED